MSPSRLAVFLAVVMATPLASQATPRLRSADFVVSGIRDGADTSTVHRILGAPDSIADGDDPSQAAPIPTWWYRDLRVVFLGGRELHGWWITGRSRTTARGLRVGASRAVVRRLYGPPTHTYGDSLLVYCERQGGTAPRCIDVWLQRDQVKTIYVGRSID